MSKKCDANKGEGRKVDEIHEKRSFLVVFIRFTRKIPKRAQPVNEANKEN